MAKNELPIRILLADDHTLFVHGLKNILSSEPDFLVVGEASNGDEALKLVSQLHPDILLLDLCMPVKNGMEVLQSLFGSASSVRTIILSVGLKEKEFSKALKLGARGIVFKESASNMLFKCIRSVIAGQFWINSRSIPNPESVLTTSKSALALNKEDHYGLTDREMEIVSAVVSGHQNKEIANLLAISEHTVKHHISSIFDKLGVYNRLELTLFVHHHELIKE